MRARYPGAIGAALAFIVLFPAAGLAQSGIAGVVRDTSGAVLPGVTVEATSPVLIEKARTAVTDSEGTYRILDLRPGGYTVIFTLTGFSTVRREGIELPAAFTATVNADLQVGAVAETITVSGGHAPGGRPERDFGAAALEGVARVHPCGAVAPGLRGAHAGDYLAGDQRDSGRSE